MTKDQLQNHYKGILDQGKMSPFQVIIVAICVILNMNDGIDVLIVSFSTGDIIKEWGLSKFDMGYVFSMGLFGMMIGSLLIAPLGDKVGRKLIFIVCLFMISLGMFLVSVCASYEQLLAFRLITGLGIGGVLPTLTATASEFSNNKNRDFNVGLVQAGWPLGAIFTGFFCAYAIPNFGWRFPFFIAGCFSLIMLIVVLIYMHDSLDFLFKKQTQSTLQKINIILKKMKQEEIMTLPHVTFQPKSASLKRLFHVDFRNSTLKLWAAMFFGFFTLYTLMSWVPTIAKDSGLEFSLATYAGVLLNVGAMLGTICLGWLARKFSLKRTVFSFLIFAFIVMLIYGNISLSTVLIFIFIFLIGVFVQGGFNGLYAILSRVYPTEIRATGVGYAVGIGRLGAILGPTFFGFLSDDGMSISMLFTLFSIPLLVTGIVVFKLKSIHLK
ncbi:MFS transporter [Flavobacterium sp. LT1R49]|uniref:MFS transporter n=1 Tax=Flavobacterium arabinosi TaxID=3398737 RepID=UPI003A8C4EBA